MEYKSRSIRLSDEVWDALQKSELSANQIIKQALMLGGPIEIESPRQVPKSVRKVSKKEQAIKERETGDVTAKAVEREDIDYSDVESTPTTNVANLRGTTGAMSAATLRATEKWRANRKPLLKPKDR